jgi:hypothetical protein
MSVSVPMNRKLNINVFVAKNNSFFVAVIAIFLLFSLVLYAFPSLFVFLFGNILGNLLLILGVVGLGYFDVRWAIGLGAIFVILYQAYSLSSGSLKVEGFEAWSPQLKADFVKFENTYNPNFQFDLNIIQKQASPEEVEYLIKNNKWPWSDSVKSMYKDAIMRNSVISMDPGVALDVAQTIYNEKAVKEMLSWNSKEGAFLLSGVTIGHTEGLPDNVNNIVRCGTGDSSGVPVMEKIVNVGYDGINGSMIQNISVVPDADIPGLVPGFKFLKGACNPCLALNDPPDYSCPFSLNVGDGGGVSTIWQNLWGLDGLVSSGSSKKNQFPLLNELKNELNKAADTLGSSSSADSTLGNVVVPEYSAGNEEYDNNDVNVESPFLNSNL